MCKNPANRSFFPYNSVENVFWGITPKRAQYGMVQEDTKEAIGFRGEGCGAAPRCKE